MMGAHLIDYYLNKNWSEILKKEKIFLKLHFLIVSIIAFGIPILFYIKGYTKGYIGSFYLVFVSFGFLYLGYIFIQVILERETLKKGLYATGILMLFTSITTTWFVQRIVMDGVRDKYLPLSTLKNQKKITLPILTIDSDEILNVWNVGEKIMTIKNSSNLPKEFLLLEESDKNTVLKILSPKYKLENFGTYYKYEDEDKLIYLYHIKKR